MGEVIPDGLGPEIEKKWYEFQKVQEDLSNRWSKHANRRTLVIALVVSIPFFAFYFTFLRPPTDFPAGGIISIERNMSFSDIAISLEEQDVVLSATFLELIVRLMGGDRSVHAGDYQFNRPRNVIRIARAVVAGDFGLEPVRIHVPAGATIEDMSVIFDKRLVRFDSEEFIKMALPYEGYLYPDTYFFLPTARADVVVQTLRDTFNVKLLEIQEDIDMFGKPLEEVMVMASLLEREESDYKDKQKIAGILWRRLDINMPLQVDATFVYIIGKGSNQLTLEDLEYDSPYNTYRNKGLPPAPIANPSLDSIRAAVNPIDENDYLFYLADRHGTTYYSATYEEHLRKKRLYLGP